MKTKSEALFESFCEMQKIQCEKIIESNTRKPDYWISTDGIRIVVEVKQIDQNKDDEANYKEFIEKGMVVGDAKPGARVRSKIKSAAPQISNLAKGKHPGILVLFNNVPLANFLDSYHLKVGMYGLDTIVLSKPEDFEPPLVLGRKSGGKRKLTENHNTSISAVGVIREEREGLFFDLYHNHFASIPVPNSLCKKLECNEYRLLNNGQFEFKSWALAKS